MKKIQEENSIKDDICEYYNNCYSGCNANAFLTQDEYKNGLSCYMHKEILKGIKNYVLDTVSSTLEFNPKYVKVLERAKVR